MDHSPCGAVYDTGDYIGGLDKVLAGAGYPDLRAEQARRRERGDVVQLGIGVASYVEITAADADNGETARVVVHDDGTATVYTGSSAHGQGHHTAWAMIVEADLGMPGGHIFHRDLSWPYAESEGDVGAWGVETAHPRVLLCGAGARRGGGVSGVPGRNAAMAVLGAGGPG